MKTIVLVVLLTLSTTLSLAGECKRVNTVLFFDMENNYDYLPYAFKSTQELEKAYEMCRELTASHYCSTYIVRDSEKFPLTYYKLNGTLYGSFRKCEIAQWNFIKTELQKVYK